MFQMPGDSTYQVTPEKEVVLDIEQIILHPDYCISIRRETTAATGETLDTYRQDNLYLKYVTVRQDLCADPGWMIPRTVSALSAHGVRQDQPL